MTCAAEKTDATAFNHTDTLSILWLSQKMRISTALHLVMNNTMNPWLFESLWIPKPASTSFNKISYQQLQCQDIIKPNQKIPPLLNSQKGRQMWINIFRIILHIFEAAMFCAVTISTNIGGQYVGLFANMAAHIKYSSYRFLIYSLS
jgi:hypothetical protein